MKPLFSETCSHLIGNRKEMISLENHFKLVEASEDRTKQAERALTEMSREV